jgi:hypothetical protein
MPYTKKQLRTARAIMHGWEARGAAKGITREFAEEMLAEQERIDAKKRAKARDRRRRGRG